MQSAAAAAGKKELPMALSTREDILATAKELFTRHGYHHVSMRSISSAMGISVGNLTYYFPRKADLADALLEQEMRQILMPARPGLDALDEYLRRMLASLLEHARLFSDYLMFLSIPELADGHRDRVGRLRANLLDILRTQVSAGLLYAVAADQSTLEDLADLLMYSHMGWQQQLTLFPEPVQQAMDHAIRLQRAALQPWLTPAGLDDLRRLHPL